MSNTNFSDDTSIQILEIKADVHTVHPSSSAAGPRKPLAAGPYGSWCTPDASPVKKVFTQKYSNNDGKIQTDDELRIDKIDRSYGDGQRVKLFSGKPPDYFITSPDDEIKDLTELQDLKKASLSEDSFKEIDIRRDSLSHIETPQSPVPSSPSKDKKFKGIHLPAYCNPFLPIDPQGRYYVSWLFLVTFCYSYNAWCIVLRATFPYQTKENTPIWMTIDYICDMIYILDVAIIKPRLMYLHEGFWVDDPRETRRNYRKKLQYKFDVISLLPLDLLYFYFGPQMVILRVPRMLKLQTFWEFHQAVDRMLSSPYVVRIGKMLFYIFYLIHLNACAYYAMSAYIGLGSNGWVYDNQGNAYIRCFYFATKTATSIGKNPKPEKTEEYLFMTVAWLMGVFVFALLIGQIRDIIATATRARAEYRKQIDGCTQYLRRLNMPKSLQRRVTSWFSYTWTQQRCFDESRILNSLPYNMKRDVALAVHMNTLSKVQLFRDCSDSLLRDLVLQLRPVSFLPGDIVVRKGDVGHQMYIIKSGECCVMSQDESEVLATLKEGSVFGEISLLGIDGLRRRTATVRARGYANLFALSRNDLEAALKHHKEAAQILRLRADQIIKENAARHMKQRLAEEEAKRSASIQEEGCTLRRRRVSSASSNDSNLTADRKNRSGSALSKRRLSAVSEVKATRRTRPRSSLTSACSGMRTPVPTIILSTD